MKYFERILTQFNGEAPPGRRYISEHLFPDVEVDFIKVLTTSCCRCMLRGFRLHNCPYWVRPSITISNHNGNQSNLLFYSFKVLNPFRHLPRNTNIVEFFPVPFT